MHRIGLALVFIIQCNMRAQYGVAVRETVIKTLKKDTEFVLKPNRTEKVQVRFGFQSNDGDDTQTWTSQYFPFILKQ